MRLANHAAFHTPLMAPIAAQGRAALPVDLFSDPKLPLIDGRGGIWWPGACDRDALRGYTLGHQVIETYDFTMAIAIAAREFAPDLFIITGPGTTLGRCRRTVAHPEQLACNDRQRVVSCSPARALDLAVDGRARRFTTDTPRKAPVIQV